ncbi:MAG TPA: hypothetical protein VGG40_09025 [Solirubrobacterales bacterium]|jgi:hypothetical protein
MPKRRNSGAARLSPAAIVFALLVLATLGAFAYAQRVKRDPLVVDRVTFGTEGHHAFTPNGDCRNDTIRIRFRTTVSDDANVQIIRPSGHLVLTLAREAFLKRYHFHTYYWNGVEPGGTLAPAGRYKLRVALLGEGRVLVLPGTIHLHRVRPKLSTAQGLQACTTAIPKDQGAGTGRSG